MNPDPQPDPGARPPEAEKPEPEAEQLELIEMPRNAPGRSPGRSGQAPGGSARSRKATGSGQRHTPAYLAQVNPVARVLVESHVPHLDRPFDYGVPRDLADQAQPGTRVRVRFGGQQLQGWVIERLEHTDVAQDRLQPILRVQSALPVLTPQTLEVARAVAARCAGVVSDVLRAAVPPRVASIEKEALKEALKESPQDALEEALAEAPEEAFDEALSSAAVALPAPVSDSGAWAHYLGGAQYLKELARGEPVRAVLQGLPPHPEHDLLDLVAQAVAVTHARGRGAVVVVPDGKSLDRLQRAVERVIPVDEIARLHSDDKPTPRYRAFVQVLEGKRRVVLGTRPAVWAPVKDPGLIVVVDDGDPNLVEQRAPYHHARDVALLRSEHEGLSMVVAGYTVTPEAARLVDTGWARAVHPEREVLRANMPRVVATSDTWHQERDSLAGRARLPETAFRVARTALADGPVLIQVARTGYAPTIACQRCRTPARCTVCEGPLKVPGKGHQPVCGWCGREPLAWSCSVCAHPRWRMSAVGSQRTAEELGRAFPQIPVISSSGDAIRRSVEAQPALVVATPGAEPWVEGGYTAALLLDGDRMLSRPGLRAEEDTLRRWFQAAALVRHGGAGGTVVVTSEHERAVATLVRWDPAGHAARELAERRTLQLPPAVRSAALTGSPEALREFLELAQLPEGVRVIGPAPVEGTGETRPSSASRSPSPSSRGPSSSSGAGATGARQETDGMTGRLAGMEDGEHRALVFFGYGIAAEVTAKLRAARAESSALRHHRPVQVRCDVADLL